MKKLLFLSALLIFSCSSDDSSNNNNSNYFFEFELFDVINRVEGNYEDFISGQVETNTCLTGSSVGGWTSSLVLGDISEDNYVSGQNFNFSFRIPNGQIGANNSTDVIILYGPYISEYLQEINGFVGIRFSEIEGDIWGAESNNKLTDIEITDFGEPGYLSNDMQNFIDGRSFKASYEKTVYFASNDFVFDIPTLLKFEINTIRGL
jgi:hypothetical protein